ncbi:MAG: hypothetical protein H7Z76_07395 [Methylotenera sp.]|nr:hypothetical protein [Flavobacterium sp.]
MSKLTQSIFLLIILLFSCGRNSEEPTNLISPIENLKITNSSKYIFESNKLPDSLNDIEAYTSINNVKIIATKKHISILDNFSKKLKKNYEFKFDNFKELISVNFSTNKDKSKLLVITSSGQSSTALVFQIDLSSFQIDWLVEYSYQIETGCYSHNSNLIALGTSYYQKKTKDNTSEYYSSLFLLNSSTGKFVDYFKQGESVSEIKFSEDDELICAVLGWPHVDTFVWNINNKNEKLRACGKDNKRYYDACFIDKKTFVSVGSDGIYKWNISEPKNHEIVYTNESKYLNGTDKIYKLDDIFILIDYPNGSSNPPIIKYFNSKFKLTDSIKMKTTLDYITISDFSLEAIGFNNSIINFDIKKKSVTYTNLKWK